MSDADRHSETVEVYQRRARDWQDQGAVRTDEATAFAAEVEAENGPTGAVLDLGCGPGWHLPVLPEGTIAIDAATAMLEQVPKHASNAPRICADLRALPLRRSSARAAWANKSYVHIQRSMVPMALWDLHRVLAVGARAHLGLFGGDAEHEGYDHDSFPGRSFSLWPTELLVDVLLGAGFDVESIDETEPARRGDVPRLDVRVRRARTLADTVGPHMHLLIVGLNPSLHAADSGIGFSGPSNRGWPALMASGLATTDRDPLALWRDHRIGMTDLVKRATARASELSAADYRAGLARLERLCAWLRPRAVCIVGLTGWRAAVDRRARVGRQPRRLGGRPVWVMPNPSGLNTHASLAELVENLQAASSLAEETPAPDTI